MDRDAVKFKFRDEFRSHHGEAFQDWFEKLAFVLHGKDCFQAIRVTRGDGGLDGLVLKSGHVYQVYAPPSLATDSATADKARKDFAKARETLGGTLRSWTLIHNSTDGKIGHLTAAALASLSDANPGTAIEALGIDGLWLRLNDLSDGALAELFDSSEPGASAKSQVRALLKRATSLAHEDNMRKAVETMCEALAIAQAERAVELEAEVLIGLCLASSRRDGLGDRAYYINQLEAIAGNIRKPVVRAMAHRARAAHAQDRKTYRDEESHLQAAIKILLENSTEKNALPQLCVTRSEYAHLLCHSKRMNEAKEQIELAETYARDNPEEEAGELLDAALRAGMHWAALARDADAVIERIGVLEGSANSAYRAARVAGKLINIANHLSHERLHPAALAAAEAALRLAHNSPQKVQENFLPGVLYTVAAAHFHAGNREIAMAKAKSLLDLPYSSKAVAIRQAANQLVSVIARNMGDTASAVNAAEAVVPVGDAVALAAEFRVGHFFRDEGTSAALVALRRMQSFKLCAHAHRHFARTPALGAVDDGQHLDLGVIIHATRIKLGRFLETHAERPLQPDHDAGRGIETAQPVEMIRGGDELSVQGNAVAQRNSAVTGGRYGHMPVAARNFQYPVDCAHVVLRGGSFQLIFVHAIGQP